MFQMSIQHMCLTWDLYRSILAWGSDGLCSTSRNNPITSRTSSVRHSKPALAQALLLSTYP